MKRYLRFLQLALEEQFPQARYRWLLKAGWSIAIFILGFWVSDYLGIPLKDIAEPAYHLLPAPWWVVFALALMVISLLLIINGARRFHDKTAQAIYEESDAIAREHAITTSKVELLTLFKGRFEALYLLLNNRRFPGSRGAPLSREEVQWHEADFDSKLLDWFGDNYRTAYFKQLGDIPDDLLAQSERLRSHSNLMHQQIQTELGRQRDIAQKANEQKQRTLEITYKKTNA